MTSPRPEPRTAKPPPIAKPKPPAVQSERSIELAAYYQRLQQQNLTNGLLRIDGGGPDTPFSKRNLVDNFLKIAAFSEASIVDNKFVREETVAPIRRWTEPVRVKLDFGQTASAALKQETKATVSPYLRRLARITGYPITLANESPNFIVAVLNVDELEAYDTTLTTLFPALPQSFARDMISLSRIDNCVVYSFEDGTIPNQIDFAVAIIRAEHPKLLRDSCFHEEIVQGLGLSNDSPAARPSIFNDDDEFALLTRHDELLLEILYDTRLPLGATPDEARPIVEVIASELLGGES